MSKMISKVFFCKEAQGFVYFWSFDFVHISPAYGIKYYFRLSMIVPQACKIWKLSDDPNCTKFWAFYKRGVKL